MPLEEIPCFICRKPVDLARDLMADENGKAVHEPCYVTRILAERWVASGKTA